ncbi:MAG: hypothetical protein M1485_03460 [Chloroflexi bacterium]|nr:hypothetical protein [Chloroflexota bacterium]
MTDGQASGAASENNQGSPNGQGSGAASASNQGSPNYQNVGANTTSDSNLSGGSSDPEQFVRSYFNSITHDRNYQYSWSLLTSGFQDKNSPGGYDAYVSFWDNIDSVDIDSINFYEQTSTDAKCAVKLTFNAKQDGSQTVDVKYHLIYDADRQTWLFESP